MTRERRPDLVLVPLSACLQTYCHKKITKKLHHEWGKGEGGGGGRGRGGGGLGLGGVC